MKTKLSEIPEYINFVKFFHAGRLEEAEESLNVCIAIARTERDKDILAHLTEFRGQLCFSKGDVDGARRHYLEAERIDGNSALSKYNFAKFFAEKVHSYCESIAKCEEIEEIVRTRPWPETAEDFSSDYYLAQCYGLEGYCYCLLRNFDKGGENIRRLLALNDISIDYGVELAELLINNGSSVKEARTYLRRLLNRIMKTSDRRRYADFIAQIKDILKIEPARD